MLQGIFFDLDNTLIRTREAQRTAIASTCAAMFGADGELDPVALLKAGRDAFEAQFGYGTPGYAELAHLSLEEVSRRVCTAAFAARGLPRDRVERFMRQHAESERAALALSPGAIDTLNALRAAGLKLGLITNGPSSGQRAKLAAFALAELFDVIVIDTEFGCPKPDHRIFDHAAAAVGLSPAELLFVGDRLSEDVGGACRAGWRSLWYNPAGEPLPPEATIPDQTSRALSDLLSLPEIAALRGLRPG